MVVRFGFTRDDVIVSSSSRRVREDDETPPTSVAGEAVQTKSTYYDILCDWILRKDDKSL